MKVTAHYFGQLRQTARIGSEACDVPDGSTVRDFLETLAGRHGEAFGLIVFADDCLRPSVMVLVNGSAIDKDKPRTLSDGDEVKLLAAIAGG